VWTVALISAGSAAGDKVAPHDERSATRDSWVKEIHHLHFERSATATIAFARNAHRKVQALRRVGERRPLRRIGVFPSIS
jgi:hypothetical protein